MSFDNLVKNYYQVDKTTYIGADELCEEALLGRDMSIESQATVLIYSYTIHIRRKGTVIHLIHQRQRP